ncbi:MAG: TonB-dependent receptor [Bacteroidia bacterium]
MKTRILVLLFIVSSYASFSQGRGEIKGTVKDAATNETIIGAAVLIGAGKGTVTDIDGNYSIKVDSGQYTLSVTYVGYEPQKLKVKVGNKPVVFNFSLQTITLNEVEVVADVAKIRETPVAFSNVTAKQIQEELSSRDLPMLLNSTPGAYATEQGGGSGDARVSIRGFDQRNVAVLVDGVPVNDMENGQVYWSNWDGLGDVTRNVQVQRGLGASKLAIASVGGTMNIITKGIETKKEITLKQEVMSDLIYKTTLGFNTGQLKGGWGITGAFAYKNGQGYVDENWTKAYAYFLKVQKRMGKHLVSLSGNGAPQSHGQRSDRLYLPLYSRALAEKLGINADSIYQNNTYTTGENGEKGLRYNPHWGYLNGEPLNERVNYFHKPQFNLSDFWNINKKLYLSTVAYASFGKGGGTRLLNVPSLNDRDPATSQINFDKFYTQNTTSTDLLYSTTLHKSTNIIQSSINNHQWYGMLSSLNYQIDTAFSAIFGIDARYYKGIHYREVYDLLGGDYFVNNSDMNQPGGTFLGDPNFEYAMKRKGDKIFINYEGYVTWAGAFAQIEYKKEKWSTFFTASASETGYQRRDFYQNKDLVLADTTLLQAVGYGDTVTYNGTKYTNQSAEARYSLTNRKWFLGYTIKGGANYNINEHQNVFVNLGYLKMAPRFALVFTSTNLENTKTKMQEVLAIEGGYGIKYPKFAANVNAYYTDWRNKPLSEFPTIRIAGDDYYYQINGLNAIHKGLELDFIYKLLKNLDLEGLASFGDWTSKTADEVYLFDINTDKPVDTILFSAQGIHVGDASQIQYGGSLRYEPIKNLYVKARYTYFTKNYANFNLLDLGVTYNLDGSIKTDNRNKESWQMPAYGLLDIFAGYDFKYAKLKFTITAGIINALDTVYISDASNGSGFNATTSTIFMGMGRRFNTGLRITF